jgi:hypothetical protein
MRWTICLGLTLSLAACRQTVVLDESAYDGGGSGGTDAGFDTGMPACTGLPIEISAESPKVMVVLDRSEDMTTRFGDNSTPLSVARDALDQYATRYQNVVWFGYTDFPGAVNCPQQGCCIGNFSPPNPKLLGFSATLHGCDQNQSCGIPTGIQRPIGSALNSSGNVFTQSDFGRYVLLITNGRPDCGPLSSGAGSCGDGGYVQGVISQLLGRGIATFVVAPGQIDQETVQCLRDLAVAGGTVSQPSYFHPSQDAADLNAEIGDIIRMIARDACTLYLDGKTVSMDPQNGFTLVWKNAQIVPRSGNNGWDVTGSGYTITLRGQWCDRLVDDGPANFQLFPSCGPHH